MVRFWYSEEHAVKQRKLGSLRRVQTPAGIEEYTECHDDTPPYGDPNYVPNRADAVLVHVASDIHCIVSLGDQGHRISWWAI